MLDAEGGRFAVTMTCAANALGRVPEGDFARCDPESARAAIEPLAAHLGTDVATAATRILDAGIAQVKSVVDAMIRDYRLDKDTAVLVGGGGGAASVTPHLAHTSGMEGRIARHNEVISPIGVALALVREQVERIVPGGATQEQILAVRAEAERAVVAQGAAAEGVEVEITVDPQTNTVRAVATGATELRTQDRSHRADDTERLHAAAASLKTDPAAVQVLAGTAAHTVYGTETRRRLRPTRRPIRIVDVDGVVRHHAADARVETTTVAGAPEVLARLVGESTSYGDGGVRAPALRLLLGSRIADLSGVLDPQPLLALARSELRARAADEPVVAVLEVRS